MTDVATIAPEGTEAAEGTVATDATIEQTAPEGEQHENGKSKRNTAPVQVTVPLDLKEQIEKHAEDAGKTAARWVLELVAKELSYELPEAKAREATRPAALFPKTLSAEAKKERFDAARTLLAALDRGDIDLDAIKQKLGM